jgi:thiamine-monophosphate kinase
VAARLPSGYSKIGDDVAVVPAGKGKVVVKTDMLVEHTDVPRGMSFRQAARKSVAMCVSDFAAKGVRPDSFMVSVGLRRDVSQTEIDELALGLRDAARKWKVRLVGGDTNESNELVIDCAMVGFSDRIVGRGRAQPGDVLVVTGYFGYPPAGLMILAGKVKSGAKFRRLATKSVLEPAPNLEAGLALAPFLTCSMDSSDGLAKSVHTLARESGVGFEVHDLPMGEGVEKFALENGLNPEKLVLEGGEEYVIVGTVGRTRLSAASAAAARAGARLIPIGTATAGEGKVVLKQGNRTRSVRDRGWTHLG